jgi:ribonuclease P protein component
LADDLAAWGRLTRRSEYQRAGKGKRVHAAAFALQACARPPEASGGGPRFGLTVTKKTGNSPARHRIKRRLREAMRRISALDVRPDHDYVLMARREALSIGFETLVADIAGALARAHRGRDGRS